MTVEAEKSIVASAIKSAAVFDLVAQNLKPSDFSHAPSAVIFEAVSEMRLAGQSVDLITVHAKVDGTKKWLAASAISANDYLASLDRGGSLMMIRSHIEVVKKSSATRSLHEYAQQIALIADDAELSAEEKLARSQALMPLLQGADDGGYQTYGDAALAAVQQIVQRADGTVSGISSGMSNVDAMTLGWEPGTLVILAGRPSHGKSALAMDWVHAGSEQGMVFVFSLEMTATNLAMRGLASLGSVDYGGLRSSKIDQHMEAKIQHAVAQMKKMPILIDDRGGISVDTLRTRARIMSRREAPKIIVTDYLTLLSGVGENRTAEVGYVSRSLKAMAKELNCCVICLAQLNRGVDSRADKRPTLSDLRDSGEIEQDADVVMFTYLHEKYDPETPRKGIGELIFAKQRNGETGSVFLEWQGKYQRFKPYHGIPPPLKHEDEKPQRRSKKDYAQGGFQ